jgi:hypothetical protein
LALAALIAFSGIVSLRRHVLRVEDESVCELLLKANGAVEAVLADGTHHDAGISRHSTVMPWLTVILLEKEGSRHMQPLLIWQDALPSEDFRVLQAWLRWKLI